MIASTTEVIRPQRLRAGDKVAVVSPAWGGAALFPRVLEAGMHTLRELGLEIVEFPTTRMPPHELRMDPQARARDLIAAFEAPEIRAIVASIGGDDSIRTLQYIPMDVIRRNPKVVMGFSDITTLLLHIRRAGVVSFYGPMVMAGLAQAPSLPAEFLAHLRAVLFEADAPHYPAYPWFVNGYPNWGDPDNVPTSIKTPRKASGPRVLQGTGQVRAELLGGCIDILALMSGTPFFPKPEEWRDRFMILETSEEAPPPGGIRRILVNFGLQGIIERLSGILVARCRDYSEEDSVRLDGVLVQIAADYGRTDMPIVTNLDFGHTDPQRVMPLGVQVEVDCTSGTLRLAESAVL